MEHALEALKQSLLNMLGEKMDWHIRAISAEKELAEVKAELEKLKTEAVAAVEKPVEAVEKSVKK